MFNSRPAQLDSIQMLRGIAAFMVLILHVVQQQVAALGSDPSVDLWLLSGLWQQGALGVDLFFIISGFIMVYVTRDMGQSVADVGRFLYKRIVRIYPLWWVLTSILTGYYLVSRGLWAAPHHGLSSPDDFIYFLKSFALWPQEHPPVIVVGWTLIHEMQFYIIFAALLFAPKRALPLLLGLWAGLNMFGFYMGWNPAGTLRSVLFSPHSLQFIIGAATALLVLKRIFFVPKIVLILGLMAICAGVYFNHDELKALSTLRRVMIYTVPFAAIIYGLIVLEQTDRLSIPRSLVVLGDWSYALYLSHLIVFIFMSRIAREAASFLPDAIVSKFSLGAAGLVDNIAYSLAAITLAIITAALCFYIIERPLLRLARRHK